MRPQPLPSKLEFPQAPVLQTFHEGFLCFETPYSNSINGVLKGYVQGAGGPYLYPLRYSLLAFHQELQHCKPFMRDFCVWKTHCSYSNNGALKGHVQGV
jgi:hypothetical protein